MLDMAHCPPIDWAAFTRRIEMTGNLHLLLALIESNAIEALSQTTKVISDDEREVTIRYRHLP